MNPEVKENTPPSPPTTPVGTAPIPSVENPPLKKKRAKMIILTTLSFLLIAALTFLYWWVFVRNQVYTDDAYVNGNTIHISSQIAGRVNAFYADIPQYVQEGQLLISIDPTDFLQDLDSKKAALAQTVRDVQNLYERVAELQANVVVNRVRLDEYEKDLKRRAAAIGIKGVSREDFEHAESNVLATRSELTMAEKQLQEAKISAGTTPIENHPLIESAKTALRIAYVNLQRCNVYAPASGYIGQRSIQVGEWISPNQTLMTIIPLEQMWIDANYKETQLEDIRIGQPVDISSDMYGGDVLYKGKIVGLGTGTGSAFSLLPPQNATGNWIKIVQRLPVRISFDPEQLKQFPLVIGLSVETTTHTEDLSGQRFITMPAYQPIAKTNIYDYSLEKIEREINEIIRNNLLR